MTQAHEQMLNLTGKLTIGALLANAIAYAHLQSPFSSYSGDAELGSNTYIGQKSIDNGLFMPLESLSYVREDEFTTMKHPYFPQYRVRVKKTKFCDEVADAYTGYIDINARHLFFYFFESRSDPAKDDVIFWTNGGPGCSSSLGLFMELGPCRISSDNATVPHPESWNTNANVFFIDQPIGVGFSYADYGETVSTTEEAAKDIAAFVTIWFENFSQFKGRKFHMAGESYAGQYVPLFAAEVYDQNAKSVEAGLTPINLVSVMIGNGFTDQLSMTLSYYDMACTPASVPPVLGVKECVDMKENVPRCRKRVQEACIDSFDLIDCHAADDFCSQIFVRTFMDTGLNPYDISKQCGDMSDLCYPASRNILAYLDRPDTRSTLGVDLAHFRELNFTSCDHDVGMRFTRAADKMRPTTVHYVSALLNRDIRVLIYAGTYDWICNWVGNERWTLDLEWSGQEEFRSQPLRDWYLDNENTSQRAGRTRSAGKRGLFTFATIDEAGHMVPYDKPKEALALVQRWIAEAPL